jgi:hypothetical protein
MKTENEIILFLIAFVIALTILKEWWDNYQNQDKEI